MFTESQEEVTTLEEINGVISQRSIYGVFQRTYHRKLLFEMADPTEKITAAVKLARLAKLWEISEIGAEVSQCIRNGEHIDSVGFLPREHEVRSVLAAASVEGFFKYGNHGFA